MFDDVESYLKLNRKFFSDPVECDECGGKLDYQGLGSFICQSCKYVMKNDYGKVREFVEKHGNEFSMVEIAEQTGVSYSVIKELVKAGKFDTVPRQKRCKECKRPITKGDMCDECIRLKLREAVANTPKRSILVRTNEEKASMHYLKKDKKR